ncbi:hypothetical protein [Flavobacterium undicola]|uniref:hypothetical protein n=1 Tax=Flavobacterium undicola TaxID=1932779 RepID=UPI0015E24D1D|nr:hypothetical protein [Flavobacterium undicola]MBA0884803.1 hypothetical protein [Flavobacterium undicola]
MSFNNHFNFNRFVRLFQQDLLINRTKYLLAILGLGLITYLLTYWFLSSSKSSIMSYAESINNLYMVCFMFFMMGVGVIVGTAFPDLTDKIKTANYLLSPGSAFEKFLVQFLLRIGIFIPIALGIFWIAIRLAKASLIPEMLYETHFFDPAVVPYFEYRLLVTRVDKVWDIWQILFMIFGFFSYGTYLFAGTTYFKRYALVKTVVISAILFFSCILFSMLLSNIFYTQTKFFDIRLQTFYVTENLDSTEFSLLSISLLSWVFFIGMAYFKLKEKEA